MIISELNVEVLGFKLSSYLWQFWQKSFIVSWAQIVSWLTRAPNIFDVLSFVLPILILPLIASAYAEVNFEGMKVLQVK